MPCERSEKGMDFNMNENEIDIKNNAIIHKDKSLNRLDLSFLKHIELSEYKKSEFIKSFTKIKIEESK